MKSEFSTESEDPWRDESQPAGLDDGLSPDLLAMLNSLGLPDESSSSYPEEEGSLDERFLAQYQSAFYETRAAIEEVMGSERIMVDLFEIPDDRSTPEVTEDDFDPEDWPIYFALRSHMRALVARNTNDRVRMTKLRWMMMPIADSAGLTFDDACRALYSRPLVIRTRALYQLWLNGIAIDKELPPLSETLPRVLRDEISLNPRIGHLPHVVDVARTCWELPGQPLDKVIARLDERILPHYTKAFSALTEEGYVALTPENRVYFISRNPTEMKLHQRNNFSWAKSFVVYD